MSGDDLGRAITAEVQRANERALGEAVATEFSESDVAQRVAGFGIVQPHLDDPSVEEIWIERFTRRCSLHVLVATTNSAPTCRRKKCAHSLNACCAVAVAESMCPSHLSMRPCRMVRDRTSSFLPLRKNTGVSTSESFPRRFEPWTTLLLGHDRT